MKKLLILAIVALVGAQGAKAQNVEEFGIFDHLSAGISLGTTGIGFEVAAPITDYLQLRAGYSFLPKISPKFDADFNSKENWLQKVDGSGYYKHTDIEGTLNMGDLKFLIDIYPFKSSSFRLTTGAYFGKEKFVEAKSLDHFINSNYWGTSGPELGSGSDTYTVVSDENGVIKADIKVNSFKPYVGIGFGRAVPKGRIGCCFDLGVQFWGKPAVYTKISDDYGNSYQRVERDRITNKSESTYDDLRDGIKTGEKFIVYPTITFRINGRIF